MEIKPPGQKSPPFVNKNSGVEKVRCKAGAGSLRRCYTGCMSTLTEIEAAADKLPAEEKQQLLRFLATRLRGQRPLAKPRIYSDEEIAAMLDEDEADGQRFRDGR